MKKIIYTFLVLVFSFSMVNCSNEDENDNIIDPEPTCSDGIQNGDEEGVDCGGSCPPCDSNMIDFSGTYVQEDQAGRPAIATMYITYGLRDNFNVTIPSEMNVTFQADIMANMLLLNPDYESNGLGEGAETFSEFLSKDVLWVAQTGGTSYNNGTNLYTGRKLTDDVMDFQLLLLYGGPDFDNPLNDGSGEQPLLIHDGVSENDKPFLPSFPYLASPF
ncbi:MAG TPA: DUF4331 family protein [Flavobacteriaceae bacterium]|nr:DUF4331 family protein [Flavobacteriaceae bacterium]